MKKLSYISALICMAMMIMLPVGCRKAPINGKLDAQWQIMSIENKKTGEVETPANRRYIDFGLHVVNLRSVTSTDGPGAVYSGNLSYDKGASTVAMDFPYNKEGDSFNNLGKWGIFTNPVKFDIVRLDSKQLVLSSPESVITCRRF